ncbi:hypothetical protein [Algoriphagus confluentis]|uniref:hypothetical protein n=1 Tax=Algoriphagus confluentis TaxID=1697556 RepID=UPI0030C6C8D4
MNRKFLLCLLGLFTLLFFAKELCPSLRKNIQVQYDKGPAHLQVSDHFQGDLLPLHPSVSYSNLGRRQEKSPEEYLSLMQIGTGFPGFGLLLDFSTFCAPSTLTEYLPRPRIFLLNRVLII